MVMKNPFYRETDKDIDTVQLEVGMFLLCVAAFVQLGLVISYCFAGKYKDAVAWFVVVISEAAFSIWVTKKLYKEKYGHYPWRKEV